MNLPVAVHIFTRTGTGLGLRYELYILLLVIAATYPTAEPTLLLSMRSYCAGHSQPEQGGFDLCPIPAPVPACSAVFSCM